MESKKQEQDKSITLENLAKSIPKRIYDIREKVKIEQEAKKNASKVWTERGEKYDLFSLELGNNISKFLIDYVDKLWSTIKEFLESSGEKSFDVDALNRKFMCEQPYLSFVPNGDSPVILYLSGFRSKSSDYQPTNISVSVLKEDPRKVQDLGGRILSEKYFYPNSCYSKWDKTISNVPELPSNQQVQELYGEFKNCVLTSTTEVLDELVTVSLRKHNLLSF